ncbi:hypothetical protein K438DRAFT_1189328 [Mycena galopus ATCC 62051]|nr:hypothetical protein K438DRAFT_1189328 [Mycena galopus ATCC 62051]
MYEPCSQRASSTRDAARRDVMYACSAFAAQFFPRRFPSLLAPCLPSLHLRSLVLPFFLPLSFSLRVPSPLLPAPFISPPHSHVHIRLTPGELGGEFYGVCALWTAWDSRVRASPTSERFSVSSGRRKRGRQRRRSRRGLQLRCVCSRGRNLAQSNGARQNVKSARRVGRLDSPTPLSFFLSFVHRLGRDSAPNFVVVDAQVKP